jgi:hypothetical protein
VGEVVLEDLVPVAGWVGTRASSTGDVHAPGQSD